MQKLLIAKPNVDLNEFYNEVAKLLGCDTSDENIRYDCRKIDIAKNIQDGFFTYYKEANPELNEEDVELGVAMLLVNKGPKVNEKLEDNEVIIYDNFISYEKNEEEAS